MQQIVDGQWQPWEEGNCQNFGCCALAQVDIVYTNDEPTGKQAGRRAGRGWVEYLPLLQMSGGEEALRCYLSASCLLGERPVDWRAL
jgi:hypothetical protein